MRNTISATIILGFIGAGAAFAQTTADTPQPLSAAATADTPTTDTQPGIKDQSTNAPAAATTDTSATTTTTLAAGANSFTESEARNRLEAHGYSAVTGLIKDDKSIWRGQATMDGKQVNVALDFKGNIVAD